MLFYRKGKKIVGENWIYGKTNLDFIFVQNCSVLMWTRRTLEKVKARLACRWKNRFLVAWIQWRCQMAILLFPLLILLFLLLLHLLLPHASPARLGHGCTTVRAKVIVLKWDHWLILLLKRMNKCLEWTCWLQWFWCIHRPLVWAERWSSSLSGANKAAELDGDFWGAAGSSPPISRVRCARVCVHASEVRWLRFEKLILLTATILYWWQTRRLSTIRPRCFPPGPAASALSHSPGAQLGHHKRGGAAQTDQWVSGVTRTLEANASHWI